MNVIVIGGGASGLMAAITAAKGGHSVTLLERQARVGRKLLSTGNGRCNLDNTGIAPERYFTSDPAGLKPLQAAVNAADPLGWFESLGLYTRTDEAGRVYPYSTRPQTCWLCWKATLPGWAWRCVPAAPCRP